MSPRDKTPIRLTRFVLPATLACATVTFLLVSAHDAAAQHFGRFGFNRSGGGSGAVSRNSGMFPKRLIQPKMGQGKIVIGPSKTGQGKNSGKGRTKGTGAGDKVVDTGPSRPRPPKGKPPKRNPGIIIPGATIPAVVVATPSGGAPPGFSGGGGGQPSSGPSSPAVVRSGANIPAVGARYVPDEVVIEVASSTSLPAIQALARRHRLVALETVNLRLGGSTLLRWRIPDRRSVPAVVRALGAETVVMSVQPNYLSRLQEAPQTEALDSASPLEQYSLHKLRLPQAHALATGDKVLIAIIDSGVDTRHPELAGMVTDTFDAIGSGDAIHPHGTAIAGAIVARARLKGTAPAAQILAARAFGTHRGHNEGTSVHIIKSLEWAVARGARIINMSFAGDRDPAVSRRLAAAREQGIVLIAAAGNAGPRSKALFPAADPNVIAVTATDEDDKLFRAANQGRHITVAAPGVDLMLPAPDGEYKMTSGTSFAAAQVSGAVALLLERNPGLDPMAVRRVLISTARDLGPRGLDPQFGAGMVDAYRATLAVTPAAKAQANAAEPAPDEFE
jgi:subtilisin family serine protease